MSVAIGKNQRAAEQRTKDKGPRTKDIFSIRQVNIHGVRPRGRAHADVNVGRVGRRVLPQVAVRPRLEPDHERRDAEAVSDRSHSVRGQARHGEFRMAQPRALVGLLDVLVNRCDGYCHVWLLSGIETGVGTRESGVVAIANCDSPLPTPYSLVPTSYFLLPTSFPGLRFR